jgi:hypothetical protein
VRDRLDVFRRKINPIQSNSARGRKLNPLMAHAWRTRGRRRTATYMQKHTRKKVTNQGLTDLDSVIFCNTQVVPTQVFSQQAVLCLFASLERLL